jgi:hypothetical protein
MATNNGGRRPGAGRKPKAVEDQSQSVLAELFDKEAERLVVANMLALASTDNKQAVGAATWLWDRKYGKVKEKVEHDGGLTIRVEYAEPDISATEATPEPA